MQFYADSNMIEELKEKCDLKTAKEVGKKVLKTYVINIMLRKDHKNIILNFITWKAMTLIISFFIYSKL